MKTGNNFKMMFDFQQALIKAGSPPIESKKYKEIRRKIFKV